MLGTREEKTKAEMKHIRHGVMKNTWDIKCQDFEDELFCINKKNKDKENGWYRKFENKKRRKNELLY